MGENTGISWADHTVKWNKKAAETGYRPRVFCASLADFPPALAA